MSGALLLLSPTRLLAESAPRYAGPQTEAFFRRWLVLGPIPLVDNKAAAPDEATQKKAFETDFLSGCGGETQLLEPLRPCFVGGKEMAWKSVESSQDIVDLGKEIGPNDYAVAYALAELESRTAISVIAALGSDDAVKVWLNGKPVHHNWVLRGIEKDQDQVVLPLQPGRNALLLKIHNEKLGWAFCLRLLGAKTLEESLRRAAKDGDLEKIDRILNQGPKIRINAKSEHGFTAWQLAKLMGHVHVTELLVKKGANTTLPMPKPDAFIDGMLSDLTSGKTPGAAVLVSRDGKVLFEKGYGYANLEHGVRITLETKFRIASITKQFTAAAILRLQEQGKLSVRDPLSKYFPDFPKGKQVTLHHLLTHTSGIHSLTWRPDYQLMAASAIDAEDLIELTKKDPYDFEPGTRYGYSNSGYFLLGEIVAKVSGQSYADYLRTQFFEPLGMKDTGVHTSDAILLHEATGYSYANSSPKKTINWNMSRIGGAGALYSTVGDLARWNDALFGGKVLGEASLKAAWTPMKVGSIHEPAGEGYGYGWLVDKLRGLLEIEHDGELPGFVSHLSGYPSEHLTVVILDNAWGSLPGLHPHTLGREIAQLYLGHRMEARPIPKVVALSDEDLDRFVGRYDSGGVLLTVTRDGSRLFARRHTWPPFEILPTSDGEFFAKVGDSRITFIKDEKGRVIKALDRYWGPVGSEAFRMEDLVAIQVAPAVLDAYVGKYDYGQRQAIMTVSREGDHLYAQIKGQPKFEIFPKSQRVFFWKAVPAQITFVTDTHGKVTGGIHEQGGRKLDVPRIE